MLEVWQRLSEADFNLGVRPFPPRTEQDMSREAPPCAAIRLEKLESEG